LIDATGTRTRRLRAKALSWLVGASSPSQAITWGQITQARPFESLRTPTGSPVEVMRRVRGMIRLEGATLRAVMTYALVVGILTLATPLAVQSVVNSVAFGTLLQPLVVLTLLLLAGLVFAGGLRVLETVVVEYMQRRLFARMAADVAHRLPEVAPDSARNSDLRELVNRFMDVATFQKIAASLQLDGVGLVLQTVVGLVVLAFYHPLLLAFDVVLIAILIVIILSVGRKAVATAVIESKAKYAVVAWLQEMAGATPLLRASAISVTAVDRADQLTNEYLSKRESHFGLLVRQVIALLALQALASATLLGLGGWLVLQGELTLGQLVAAELIVTAVVGSMAKFGKHIEQFYDATASLDKLGQLIDLPLFRSGRKSLPATAPATLRVTDATFGYQKGVPVLRGISLAIEPGERIVLSGPAGSGKSLLLSALAGEVQPTSGEVRLGGERLQDLRMSTVGSKVRLLSRVILGPGTLLDNMRLANPSMGESEVMSLLARLGATELVEALPSRLQTQIAGAHSPLPHDLQVQLCLARELIAGPAVMLVDGLLDGVSPACREAALHTLSQSDQAVVIATHHPGILSTAERELRLTDGRLVETSR
jgi:putative ABC transport system ATP-binding protein